MNKLIQLYAFYPVKGGCPHCKAKQFIPTPEPWVRGLESVALARCSECEGGFYIRLEEKGKPLNLTQLPHLARPKTVEVAAQAEDGIVILPQDIIPKTQA